MLELSGGGGPWHPYSAPYWELSQFAATCTETRLSQRTVTVRQRQNIQRVWPTQHASLPSVLGSFDLQAVGTYSKALKSLFSALLSQTEMAVFPPCSASFYNMFYDAAVLLVLPNGGSIVAKRAC